MPPSISNLDFLSSFSLNNASLTVSQQMHSDAVLLQLECLLPALIAFTVWCQGSLPPELFYLGSLGSLDFGANRLTGTLPANIGCVGGSNILGGAPLVLLHACVLGHDQNQFCGVLI